MSKTARLCLITEIQGFLEETPYLVVRFPAQKGRSVACLGMCIKTNWSECGT